MPQLQNYTRVSDMLPNDILLFYKDSAGLLKTITFDNFSQNVVSATAVTGLPAVSSIAELQAYSVATVPDNAQLSVSGYYEAGDGGAGIFYYDATSTAASDGGTVFAPNSGGGRWFRLIQGKSINTKMFGVYADGVRDDTPALQLAFTAMRALAPNVTLVFSPGTYLTTEKLIVEGNQVKILGQNSLIKASTTIAGSVLQIGDGGPAAVIEFLDISDLYVDADNKSPYGIHIKEAQNVGFVNVIANSGTTAAWFVDGSSNGGNIRLLNILFENCFAGSATQACYGFYFNKGGNFGSYERFTMLNCGAESCTNLIRCVGSFGMEVIGGTFQNASVSSVYASATQLTIRGAYFEAGGSIKDLVVDNGAQVVASGVVLGQGITYNDTASTVFVNDASYVNALGRLITNSTTGNLSDRANSWGGPTWPTGLGGSTNYKGLNYTDKYGVRWMCTKSSPNSYWIPRDGYFIIPMPYNEFSNGKLWWWAMEDFVVTDMFFVVTTTFTGTATQTGFGNDGAAQQAWFSLSQCAIGNLTAGTVINAASNAHGDAILDGLNKAYLIGRGDLEASASTSSIRQFGDATGWTAGMAYMLVRGFNLKFN